MACSISLGICSMTKLSKYIASLVLANKAIQCVSEYSIKLYIGITISKFSAVPTCSSLISKLHLVNGAQFFKAYLVAAAFAAFAASALIVPSTKIYASA